MTGPRRRVLHRRGTAHRAPARWRWRRLRSVDAAAWTATRQPAWWCPRGPAQTLHSHRGLLRARVTGAGAGPRGTASYRSAGMSRRPAPGVSWRQPGWCQISPPRGCSPQSVHGGMLVWVMVLSVRVEGRRPGPCPLERGAARATGRPAWYRRVGVSRAEDLRATTGQVHRRGPVPASFRLAGPVPRCRRACRVTVLACIAAAASLARVDGADRELSTGQSVDVHRAYSGRAPIPRPRPVDGRWRSTLAGVPPDL